MDRRLRNNKNLNLFTIDETNENSFLQSALPKESLDNKNTQNDISNKENLEFTKIPKFLTSTINKAKEQTNTLNKNVAFTPSYPTFESSVKPLNNYTNLYSTTELFSKRKNLTNKSYRLIVSNFPYNSTQKILYELNKFGEIKEYFFMDNNTILIIEYDNYLNAIEAEKNFNVRLIDKNKPVKIEIIHDEENLLNQNRFDRMERKESKNLSKDIRIDPPNVAYFNHIVDFFLNW